MGIAEHEPPRPQTTNASDDQRHHLTSQPHQSEIHIGIHWSSGASDEITVLRPAAARTQRAATVQELIRQLGPTHTNQQLAQRLNADGRLTASGRPFSEESVRWMRWKHRVASPSPFGDEEVGVHDLAQRLDVGDYVIYKWIQAGTLQARRVGHRKLAISLTTRSRPPAANDSPILPEPDISTNKLLPEVQYEGAVDEISYRRGQRYLT